MKRISVLLLTLLLLACGQSSAPEPPLPSPTPLSFCVILDAGHGGFDPGAIGAETGVKESDLNLAVAQLVCDALRQRGVSVTMTRTDENALASTKREDMQARGAILADAGADCTVSIHMNKFENRSVSGPMTFFQAGSEDGERLAASVIAALCDALKKPPRGANPANNFVTRIPAVPSVLVECGFLSNADDERNLCDPEYQALLADAIASGVLAFLTAG